MCEFPFGVILSLSGVRKAPLWLLIMSAREVGKTDEGESKEKARFGVFEFTPLGVPGIGAGAANTLNSARKSRVSSYKSTVI